MAEKRNHRLNIICSTARTRLPKRRRGAVHKKTTGARGVRDPVVAFGQLNLAGGHDGGSDLLLTGEDARHPDAVVLVGNAQALLSGLGLALEQDL